MCRQTRSSQVTQHGSCGPSRPTQGSSMSSITSPLSEVGMAGGPTQPSVGELAAVREHAADAVRVGVIGYGYWGPNIVRNLHALDHCEVAAICDRSPAALGRARRVYPAVPLSTDF